MDDKEFLEVLQELASLQGEDDVSHGAITYIDGYKLVCTCIACPEQYDVFKINEDGSETVIAYMRLRHGLFYASCPFGGIVVYETTDVQGDGSFYNDEREHHLTKAIQKIKKFYEINSMAKD